MWEREVTKFTDYANGKNKYGILLVVSEQIVKRSSE